MVLHRTKLKHMEKSKSNFNQTEKALKSLKGKPIVNKTNKINT